MTSEKENTGKRLRTLKACCLLFILLVGLLTPSFVRFVLEIVLGDSSPLESLKYILCGQFAKGRSMYFFTALGLIPFFVLSIILFGCSRKLTGTRFLLFAVFGLVGILACMIPAHVSVWYPLYTNERMSSTEVIAFLFIPFFCLPTMVVGLGIATLLEKIRVKANHGQALTNDIMPKASGLSGSHLETCPKLRNVAGRHGN